RCRCQGTSICGGRRQSVVAVVALVGNDEHGGVVGGAFDVLPRRAALGGAAPIVAAGVRGPLDGLLPVLAPRVVVAGDVRRARAYRGHARRVLHPVLALLRAVAPVAGGDGGDVGVRAARAGRLLLLLLPFGTSGERRLSGGHHR
uniref:Uncharacterized protein n=1 Tax=Triticum urartu TaxID=4572 RepID=A0A8R7QKW2_TRIUA